MACYHESYSKPTLGLSSLGQRYVYRVLREDENPQQDLVCKAPHSMRSLAQHIEDGLTHPSRFISTTTDLDAAIKWADTADSRTSDLYDNTRSIIVKIDTEYLKKYHPHSYSTAFDLTQHCNREYYLTNDKQVIGELRAIRRYTQYSTAIVKELSQEFKHRCVSRGIASLNSMCK